MKGIASSLLLTFMLILMIDSVLMMNCLGWSNGGYSSDSNDPDYGTHDWIAQHALDWLPDDEKWYIFNNVAAYLYGTELPDNGGAPDGIGDTTRHHIYFDSEGKLTYDEAAARAMTEFNNTLSKLRSKDYENAAKNAGVMTHYITDMAVFAHVLGSKTDWGNENYHDDYEKYVNKYTPTYDSTFNMFLVFDGNLSETSAYDAAVNVAYDTTFDEKGRGLTAVWMDRNYNWSNPTFEKRVGESLNLAVNYIADFLHMLHLRSDTSPPPPPDFLLTFPPVILPLWTIGAVIATIALIAVLAWSYSRSKQPKGKLVRLC